MDLSPHASKDNQEVVGEHINIQFSTYDPDGVTGALPGNGFVLTFPRELLHLFSTQEIIDHAVDRLHSHLQNSVETARSSAETATSLQELRARGWHMHDDTVCASKTTLYICSGQCGYISD